MGVNDRDVGGNACYNLHLRDVHNSAGTFTVIHHLLLDILQLQMFKDYILMCQIILLGQLYLKLWHWLRESRYVKMLENDGDVINLLNSRFAHVFHYLTSNFRWMMKSKKDSK
jgi:hypothetical protein